MLCGPVPIIIPGTFSLAGFGMQHVDCPKCGSPRARYESNGVDVTLRCLCGYLKVVSTTLGSVITEHIDAGGEVRLPRKESKLYVCLVALCGMEEATTSEITEFLNFGEVLEQSSSVVSSQLTVLRYKGLVKALINRKGLLGGSTWVLTPEAVKLIKGV